MPYYDLAEKTYKTATSDSVILHVLPGLIKDDQKNKGIITNLQPSIPRQFYWFTLLAAVIIGCIAYQVVFLRKGKRDPAPKTNPQEVKEIPVAQKNALEILSQAKLAMEQGHQRSFYYEVQNALWN